MAKLKIEYVPIKDLKLNPRNPRVHPTSQVLALKGSLEEYDWTGPVLAQKGTKIVIKGHGTIKAARLRGDNKVPVIFHDWTDEKVKAYMIADNKLGELSYWDERELSRLLIELGENMDLKDLGFNERELDKLLKESVSEKEIVLKDFFEVIIDCSNEADQKKIFNELTKLGYKCRVLIL